MPNHVTNYVEIKGSPELIAQLVGKTLKTNDGITEFDFNGIIPMPQELLETASPTEVVATQDEADQKNADYFSRSATPHSEEYRYISQSEADRRAQLYGERRTFPGSGPVLNWYDWAVKYWGTKWNAYDVSVLKQEPDRLVLQFDTAWSAPEPIFDTLVADGLTVNCMWQDENDSNFGVYGEPWDVFERVVDYEFLG